MKILVKTSLIITGFLMSSFVLGAKYELVGPAQIGANCSSTFQIMIDTQGNSTNASDIKLSLDPTKVLFEGFESKGGVFQSYTSPLGTNPIAIMGMITTPGGFNGSGLFGTIKIKPLSGTKTFDIALAFSAGGDDKASTISSIGKDGKSTNILSEVKNLSVQVTGTSCAIISGDFIDSGTGIKIIENTTYISQNPDADRTFMIKYLIKKYESWILIIALLIIALTTITIVKKRKK